MLNSPTTRLSSIDLTLESRSITFENPTGERGTGGREAGGRKGAPARVIASGETVVLADIAGPGTIRRLWLTFPPGPPELMRALILSITYDDFDVPSVSVPCLDFFGAPHGRPVAYDSALTSIQEGRGFNAYIPMPFRGRARIDITNASPKPVNLFFQVDYTLGPVDEHEGYLHASWRRENPTTSNRDMTILDGLRGPGRFLGCSVGVRILDEGLWYGEGEVKFYLDGDDEWPTLCGTGLEDYAGSAWGLGPHFALYAGAPLEVRRPDAGGQPDFVSFYRWHVADPIVFRDELRVTIQQIGYAMFTVGEEAAFEQYASTHAAAGRGWQRDPRPGVIAAGIAERIDDYCATAFVYCRTPQSVPPVDVSTALADIERLPHEEPTTLERMIEGVAPPQPS